MKRTYFSHHFFYGVLSLVSLGILLKTYDYLNKLEQCSCFNDARAYHKLKINIDFLKAYQILEIFLILMFIVILFFYRSLLEKITVKKKYFPFPLTFLSSSVVLLLVFVSGYLTYNVFSLYTLSKAKCKCIDKWQKYFIYVQGIMGSVTFMRIIILLLVAFLLSLSARY